MPDFRDTEMWCRGCACRDAHIDRLAANLESERQANADLTADVMRLEARLAILGVRE